jgi:hypothetical protein
MSTFVAPTDIELPKDTGAKRAALHRDGDDWTLIFLSEQEPSTDPVPLSVDGLAEAGIDASHDRAVVGYVETRLLAAGYGIAPWHESPPDASEGWTLR